MIKYTFIPNHKNQIQKTFQKPRPCYNGLTKLCCQIEKLSEKSYEKVILSF
ncbi:hypothetical protein HAL07_13760 [Helicobacter ailurogastricus]|uniref:Uncharacterized protein n=1 Tax=Helicobacter ailurogastricus TaxID=1578720 RepID=A0A0K2Y0T4_9HELI|nr:hypothetical protein HAL07_13760 [Helicobacter ailurogastricus]